MNASAVSGRGVSITLAALVLTLLNCCKPLHIDDSAYYCYAAHIANEPLSPYGFRLVWNNEAKDASEVLAPPVLLYWWAAGIRLFGDSPFLWKLWLFPFCLLLALALYRLFRRFARRFACWLTWMALLSPAVLPSLNLMLDVPVLALSLTAVVLFLRAADRNNLGFAIAAGLMAGLAMETKYTAFVTPGVLASYGLLFGRKRLAIVAVLLSVALFISWEAFIAAQHGQSHFLSCLADQQGNLLRKATLLVPPLITILGCLAPATLLLGMTALGMRGRTLALASCLIFAGYGLIALLPEGRTLLFANNNDKGQVHVWHLIYGAWGIALWTAVGLVGWRLLKRKTTEHVEGTSWNWRERRVELFLLLWLAGELAGYFALSPFPAARRVLGPSLVLLLLVGRLLGRTCRLPEQQRATRWVVGFGICLGLGFFLVDLRDATAARCLIEETALRRENTKGRTTWLFGDGALGFYGVREGLTPLVLDRSIVRKGDWLLIAHAPVQPMTLAMERVPVTLIERIEIDDALPLRTVLGYYGGRVPLERRQGPRVSGTLYQATADFIPSKAALWVK